jgi:hypothetical protein
MITTVRKLLETKWPALLWTLIIFIALTVSTGTFERGPLYGIPNLDKLIHAFIFGVLVFLWWKYLSGKPNTMHPGMLLLILFLLSSAYGAGMEYYQKYFTTREFELGDIYADTVGAAISAIVCGYIKK